MKTYHNPGECLLKVLSSIRPLEQAGFPGNSHNGTNPIPVIIWRFHDETDALYASIHKCIDSYSGKIKWVLFGKLFKNSAGINYGIAPEYYLIENLTSAHVSVEYFSKHKDLIDDSNSDLLLLCTHIARCFNIDFDKCIKEDVKIWRKDDIK